MLGLELVVAFEAKVTTNSFLTEKQKEWLDDVLNYQVAPDFDTEENYSYQCQAQSHSAAEAHICGQFYVTHAKESGFQLGMRLCAPEPFFI
jgi:hypothetical protein